MTVAAYVGQARGRVMGDKLNALGIGEMTVRGELPPRRRPWAFDNGAFRDWKAGKPFDDVRYAADIEAIRARPADDRPDFIIVPDRVASPDSLAFSLSWVPRLAGLAPLALAVQDGMTQGEVRAAVSGGDFALLFVGGTLKWKLETGESWVRLAHSIGLRCHIGRIGTCPRLRWAREIGADSIDSCTPLFSNENFARFVIGLREPFTRGFLGPTPPPARAEFRGVVRKARAG